MKLDQKGGPYKGQKLLLLLSPPQDKWSHALEIEQLSYG